MRGLGNIYKRGPVYWIRYHHHGRRCRESTRSPERADAVRLLKQRLAQMLVEDLGRPPHCGQRTRRAEVEHRTYSRSTPRRQTREHRASQPTLHDSASLNVDGRHCGFLGKFHQSGV